MSSWLETIRKRERKVRPIRELSESERELINEHNLDQWKLTEGDHLDSELRRMWTACAILFTTLLGAVYLLLTLKGGK